MLNRVRFGVTAALALAAAWGVTPAVAAAAPAELEKCDPNATLSAVQFKEAPTLDPAKTFGPTADGTRYWIYDPLIRVTPDGGTAPGLATSWSFVTPTEFNLKLRQGVTFHDGTPFNAAAVKANFDRNRAFPGVSANWAQPLAVVKEVKVVSEFEVQYVLHRPSPAFSFNLTSATGMIVSPAALNKPLDVVAVGTGPFKLVKYTPNASADLVRNDQYWDKAALACSPKAVRLLNIVDTQALLNAAISGQLNISHVDPNQVPLAKAAGLVLRSVPTQAIYAFWYDYKNPALRNPLVRKAMMYAIDRGAMAKAFGPGLSLADAQLFPPGFYAYSPEPQHQPAAYPYDPAKAKQLLAEAGYPKGLTLKVLVLQFPFDQTLLQAIQAQMAKAGITLTTQIISNFASYIDRQGDMYFGTGNGRADPLDYIQAQVSQNGIFNPDSFPPPPELAALLEQIGQTSPDDPKREKMLQQASGMVTDHGLLLAVMVQEFNWVLHRCVANFKPPRIGALQPIGLGWKAGCK